MAIDGKIRIYDLARENVPEPASGELSEKERKKIQAEITRQILAIAPKHGQSPKTASSAIDAEVVDLIMSEVDISALASGSTKSSTSPKAKVVRRASAETSSTEEEPKKKMRIVRRISPQNNEPSEAEKAKAEELKREEEAKARAEAALTGRYDQIDENDAEPVLEEESEETVEEISKEEEDNLELKKFFDDKKETAKSETQSSSPRNINNVKAIPLRPSYQSGQPYRVAKPKSSGQGRSKKRRNTGDDDRARKPKQKPKEIVDDTPKEFTVTGPMSVRELAHGINFPETQIITYFFMKKIIKTVNDMLEKDLIIGFLEDNNFIVKTDEKNKLEHEELLETLIEDEEEGSLMRRPPVVTIMGHVDHGKTTLLDSIRRAKQKVVDAESGGITQHISAYSITTTDLDEQERKITFIDTPGHEAFTAMRKRGAYITDIVILIVAADDGIMPQTLESIEHIKEAKVPFLVAVNKVDKPEANSDKVLGQLAERDIVVEQYGGKIACSMISALKQENLEDLLEKIILVADAELDDVIRSNPNRPAIGTVIEAELSRSKGPLATLLVQNGTLKVGDNLAAGAYSGRVKALFNENDEELKEAGPSSPVKILGFSGVPKAGDQFKVYKSAAAAKDAAEQVANAELEKKRFAGLASYVSEIKEGQGKELRVIIKADVQGSAEAIAHELCKLSTEEVLLQPIAIDSGSITSNDVSLAERTGAVIIGFHVGSDAGTAKMAEKTGVAIKSYEVIYKITEDIERAMLGLHDPDLEEERLGTAEVRQLFTISNRNIAGCYITGGKVVRNEIARVLRDGVQIYEGKVDYLKRFKDDAKEVKEGFECGMSFEKYNDLQEGDVIECWTVKEIVRTKL